MSPAIPIPIAPGIPQNSPPGASSTSQLAHISVQVVDAKIHSSDLEAGPVELQTFSKPAISNIWNAVTKALLSG